jgi:putative Mn2+ efflux pump MntP
MITFGLLVTAMGLGAGLAMDAFSMSLADGLHEPSMRRRRICLLAGVFAFFQFAMPMIGWLCVHTAASYFSAIQPFIPFVALALLLFIGGKMLWEGLRPCKCEEVQTPDGETVTVCECPVTYLGFGALIVQGIATSIDALSVGFTIADYDLLQALVACLVIGVLTFFICAAGVVIGKKFGTKLEQKASVFGGAILILIGIKIFVEGVLLA